MGQRGGGGGGAGSSEWRGPASPGGRAAAGTGTGDALHPGAAWHRVARRRPRRALPRRPAEPRRRQVPGRRRPGGRPGLAQLQHLHGELRRRVRRLPLPAAGQRPARRRLQAGGLPGVRLLPRRLRLPAGRDAVVQRLRLLRQPLLRPLALRAGLPAGPGPGVGKLLRGLFAAAAELRGRALLGRGGQGRRVPALLLRLRAHGPRPTQSAAAAGRLGPGAGLARGLRRAARGAGAGPRQGAGRRGRRGPLRRVRRQRLLPALRRAHLRGLQGLLQAHGAEERQVHLPGQQRLPCGQAAQEPLPVLPLPEVPGRGHGQRSGPDRQPEGSPGPAAVEAEAAAGRVARQPHHLAGAGAHRLRAQRHQARLLQVPGVGAVPVREGGLGGRAAVLRPAHRLHGRHPQVGREDPGLRRAAPRGPGPAAGVRFPGALHPAPGLPLQARGRQAHLLQRRGAAPPAVRAGLRRLDRRHPRVLAEPAPPQRRRALLLLPRRPRHHHGPPRAEGAEAGGGAAEPHRELPQGPRDGGGGGGGRARPPRRPLQAAGQAARAAHPLHPGPPAHLLPEAGGPGAAAAHRRQDLHGHVALLSRPRAPGSPGPPPPRALRVPGADAQRPRRRHPPPRRLGSAGTSRLFFCFFKLYKSPRCK